MHHDSSMSCPLCACGCGQAVGWDRFRRQWNRYIHGHNAYTPPRTRPCECGCGTILDLKSGRSNKRFAPGHNNRLRSSLDNFWTKVQKTESCWIWKGARGGHGYGSMTHGGKHYTPAQFSYQLHYGAIPEHMQVCHSCDNPPCVRPDHLFLGTATENMRDMTAKRRNGFKVHPERLARGNKHGSRLHPEKLVRGERHHKAKLTETDVQCIRQAYSPGNGRELARRFGVTPSTISTIVRGKHWKGI